MLERLEEIKNRYIEVGQLILQPEIMSDMKNYAKLSKEYKDLTKIVSKYDLYTDILSNIKSSKQVLFDEKDPEFREMAKQELETLELQKETTEADLKELLLPKDPNDDKNAILEIRAGTGGDEAGIFVGDLFRMYQRFCERVKLGFEVMHFTEASSGGYKEIVCLITGEEAYGTFKFESGVHRVQRVPATESQGRVHTSAATVAVLPEMDEVEVDLNMADVKKDTFRASGAGGQHVNKTESAIRLTHLPTGLVVECQEERSQIKNFDKALKVLRARLYDAEVQKQNAEVSQARQSMVKSGDRSEKIRTYNYPQGRVTDHRISFSLFNINIVMDGGIEDFVEQLKIAENASKLKEGLSL